MNREILWDSDIPMIPLHIDLSIIHFNSLIIGTEIGCTKVIPTPVQASTLANATAKIMAIDGSGSFFSPGVFLWTFRAALLMLCCHLHVTSFIMPGFQTFWMHETEALGRDRYLIIELMPKPRRCQ